jgi:hypothetical protein
MLSSHDPDALIAQPVVNPAATRTGPPRTGTNCGLSLRPGRAIDERPASDRPHRRRLATLTGVMADEKIPGSAGPEPGRGWLAALPAELAAQQRVMAGLVDRCEAWPFATSFLVGCSLGRGAADALSDIDAALGVDAEPGEVGAGRVDAAEATVVAALPELGPLVDVLRQPSGTGARRIFAQFADRTQLDLAVVPQATIDRRRRDGGAPDFIPLYETSARPVSDAGGLPVAYAVSGDQVREWSFLGWCALIDADKYLRRGSLWEAHARLHQGRQHIWALWAAAQGALYPWGSQRGERGGGAAASGRPARRDGCLRHPGAVTASPRSRVSTVAR